MDKCQVGNNDHQDSNCVIKENTLMNASTLTDAFYSPVDHDSKKHLWKQSYVHNILFNHAIKWN